MCGAFSWDQAGSSDFERLTYLFFDMCSRYVNEIVMNLSASPAKHMCV